MLIDTLSAMPASSAPRTWALSVAEKVRENRIREKARRYGLRLSRSRDRDSSLSGSYGLWNDAAREWALAGPDGWGRSLEDCEAFLAAPQSKTT